MSESKIPSIDFDNHEQVAELVEYASSMTDRATQLENILKSKKISYPAYIPPYIRSTHLSKKAVGANVPSTEPYAYASFLPPTTNMTPQQVYNAMKIRPAGSKTST